MSSHGRVRCENAVIMMAMFVRRGDERSDPVEELNRAEIDRGNTSVCWLGESIYYPVFITSEVLTGKARPGTVTDKPFQSFTIPSLNTHIGV